MSATARLGVGSQQASAETWYGIVADKGRDEPTFYSRELYEGQLTLYIFAPPERGEPFITFRGLRPEWRVLAYPAHTLIPLIEQATTGGLQYVTINPSDRRGNLSEDPNAIPIQDFLASLRDRYG